jgi:hypothetical protein
VTFDERTKGKALIEKIFQRQLDKPIVYHPTIMREFNEEERNVIFGGPYVLEDYTQEIDAVLRCVEHDNITSPRIILGACKMMIPRKISGFYDCNLQIELWINSVTGELLIESHSEHRTLTKGELLALY